MGNGHFVVAMFERLVALRLAEETLGAADAVDAVITEDLFGLEIDPRCTQIGAFNPSLFVLPTLAALRAMSKSVS